MAVFLVRQTAEAVLCAHPSCDVTIEEGGQVFPARLRNATYCSTLCRERDTKRLIQERRRATPANRIDNDNRIFRKYGINREEWDRLYDLQLGRCAICVMPLSETRPHVDHNHETGEVRGLLCNLCNPGLGYFRDDPVILLQALRYLSGELSLGDREGVKDT